MSEAGNSDQDTEKRHATTMSDTAFIAGCLAIGLSQSEVARIMRGEEPMPTAKRESTRSPLAMRRWK
jgi:hypothetical protein